MRRGSCRTRWRRRPRRRMQIPRCAGARGHGAKPRSEGKDIQALIDAQQGGFKLAAVGLGVLLPSRCARRSTIWTRRRSSRTSSSNNVLQNGVFYAANQLYGITLQGAQGHPGLSAGRARLRGVRRGRQAAGALLLRLLQARQQERRRVDEQLRRPVEAAGHAAGGLQRRQLPEARARRSRRSSASTT